MPRKRKASKALDECQREEDVGHEPLGGTLLASTLTLPASQTMEGDVELSKNSQHPPEVGTSTVVQARDLCIKVPGNDCETSKSHSGRKVCSAKRKKISEEALLKRITVACAWNMCTAEFSKVERFISHVTEHLHAITDYVSNDGFLCLWRECDFTCSTKEEMNRHVYFHAFHSKIKSIGAVLLEENNEKCILDSSECNWIPETPDAFECLWEDCNVRFDSAHDFYCHTLGHVSSADKENSNKKAFECAWDGCSSSFAVASGLRIHIRSHTQEKTVGCPNCGGIFATYTTFYEHCMRQIPSEAHRYQCSHCLRRFATERFLHWHVRQHINNFRCPECGMTVHNKFRLEEHILHRHRNDKPHICPQCGKGFTFPRDLRRHLAVHSTEPTYSCLFPYCSYKARHDKYLTRHMKLVHEGVDQLRYACHVCSASYVCGASLSKHLMKIHNFKRPQGHTSFKYRQDEKGIYRLETIRYDRVEQSHGTVSEECQEDEENAVDSPEISTEDVVESPETSTEDAVDSLETSTELSTLPSSPNTHLTPGESPVQKNI